MKYFQFIVVLLGSSLIAACGGPQHSKMLNPHYSEESLMKLRSYRINAQINQTEVNLHFVDIKDVRSHPVVMIHGTPGSWSTFNFILGNTKLQKTNHLISVDRLDWGLSKSVDGEMTFPEFDEQIDAIAEMIRAVADQPVILVGHSLGASFAPSVAIKYPELVKGMVLVAGTVDPELGGPRWFNIAARLKVVQWFLSDKLIKSNREVFKLKSGLIDAKEKWKDLTIPITVIQGSKDKLVNPNNVAYVQKNYADKQDLLKVIKLPEMGHFIPWEATEVIIDAIQKMNKGFDAIEK